MQLKNTLFLFSTLGCIVLFLYQCEKDLPLETETNWVYNPTPFVFDLPPGLTNATFLANLPEENVTTIEGVKLGRLLFYDPILSADSTLSCSGCHSQANGFTDKGLLFSIGIDGIAGNRNAMPIYNLGYQPLTYSLPPYDTIGFFWDGRTPTMETQALKPIQDPIEMHEVLEQVVLKLCRSSFYPKLFYEAFGTDKITSELVGNAIAQFERTIISGNSKYDKAITPGSGVSFTDQEFQGFVLFGALDGGDCFHCHVIGGTFTDYTYRNNGLDEAISYTDFTDPGYGKITEKEEDYGKFKVPTLRNIALTAPYMHDGRFLTLEEVLEHYSTGVKDTPFTDSFMQFAFQGGVALEESEKSAIIAFLKTLTDSTLITNPNYASPF